MTWVADVAADVEAWMLALSSTWWVFAVLFAFCTIDGFFPPVPSESVVIALAVASRTSGDPNLGVLLVVALAGAWTGDQLAFALGRRVGTDRVPWLRTRRGLATVAWARRAIEHRGASFILGARYVPIGRVAVNMTAGAVGYPRARFAAVTALAAVMWATYSTVVGVVAAAWLGDSTILAMVVGVAGGVATGVLVDRALARLAAHRLARLSRAAEAAHADEG